MEPKSGKELRIQMPVSVSSCTEPVVASPMTQLAMNFEGICTRTPTGPKCTPRRKLSLGEIDNNTGTPILSSKSFSRRVSSESGYCPSPDRQGSLDSPSADFISSKRRRSISKPIRRSALIRSISSPFASCVNDEENLFKDNADGIPEENVDANNNKENDFEFAKPTMPIYRSSSNSGRQRPISAPPELMSAGMASCMESNDDCDEMVAHFSVDEDDDGFIDYAQLEQNNEDDAFAISSTVAGLMTKPLSSSASSKSKLEPCGLFHPITCKSASPDVKPRRSKSVSMKRPVPPRDPSPEERKKLRARCSSALEASWNSPLLLAGDRKPPRSPLMRSMSVIEPRTRLDIDTYLNAGQDNSNLTGDFSKQNILPTIKGQHQDLKTVTPQTVAQVLNCNYQAIDQVYIIDCRYPYEYEGGHIRTAMNMHTKEEIFDFFLKRPKSSPDKRTILIFHCEFSSKRAPTLYRYLRNKDRDSHTHCYPKLFYPEIYVIHGGYKAFYETCKLYPTHFGSFWQSS
ncbi:M-phase inducer phosphatase 1-like isoform X2 [Dendronephthya gigantea]|uniref:M-phase inducer phosphatase 1-like isoform X2 n=1 Tax=Dendronephthya gigantea TaxID=151771 RepID=UPI00106CA466|nr:M-phase inducer phosphatase 1-like isoform X2 [Dendronephthya gigantea]